VCGHNSYFSWKCFRGQKLDTQTAVSTNATALPEQNVARKTSDWLDDADDWGSDENDDKNISSEVLEDPNGNFETSLDKLSLEPKSIRRQSSTSSSEMSPSVDDPNANQLFSPESSG
jgi:hypothetical protein